LLRQFNQSEIIVRIGHDGIRIDRTNRLLRDLRRLINGFIHHSGEKFHLRQTQAITTAACPPLAGRATRNLAFLNSAQDLAEHRERVIQIRLGVGERNEAGFVR
jgi:hypothetical protein